MNNEHSPPPQKVTNIYLFLTRDNPFKVNVI
ncbi:hypothetical protein BH18THE2_BH18THE2_09090 [soil metagenome]